MPVEALTPPGTDAPLKRGSGRPKGSKNKSKNPVDQVASEVRGNGDAPPGGGPSRTRKKRVSKKTTEAIEEALAELLTAPAMAAAIVGDRWAEEHFISTGKELAHRIAIVSERNSQLRVWCEKALDTESIFVVGLAAAAYAIPPLIHWNIIPGPEGMLGVPRRPSRRRPNKPTDSTAAGTEWDKDDERLAAEAAMQAENRRRSEEAMGDEPVAAQFSDDGEAEPPTFIETPL
jgi:hypothetical protein